MNRMFFILRMDIAHVAGVGSFSMLKNKKLFSLFVIFLLFLVFIASSSPSKPYKIENQNLVSNEHTNAEEELRLRYYLRKFHKSYCGWYGPNITLNLNLLVEGANDVDCVLVMCTPLGNSSYNLTMDLSSTENLYTSTLTIPRLDNISTTVTYFQPYTIDYEVQYFVNTSSGQSILSEVCPYQFYFRSYCPDASCVLYDIPDLWYVEGTTGHEITWELVPGQGNAEEYQLSEDGYLIEQWIWSGSLTINVDGLSLGDHEFKVYAYTGGFGDLETVTVHVVTELPTSVTTDDTEPLTNTTNTLVLTQLSALSVIAGSVTLIFVALIIYRSRIKSH